MRFLTFKNIFYYIFNMNNENYNSNDKFDIESRGYESFSTINLNSEPRSTLITNNNEKDIQNNYNCFENINCIGVTCVLLFFGGIITLIIYFSSSN
jgi:hypothetical protein